MIQYQTQLWRQLVSRDWQLQDLRLKLGVSPNEIKPTLIGFSGEYGSILVLIKTRNAPIPSMNIRKIEN